MKRNLLLSTLLLASASMAAQGFDGSFDGPWETCYPDGKTAVGTQPKGWMASSVCKNFIITMKKELVEADADRIGNEDGHSVRMWNDYVGMFGIGATAPGYITLGKAWAYGDVSNVGTPEDTSDGGAYGGVAFTSRPDSLAFYIKRTHAHEKPANGSFNESERATVVFYSWTGSSVSKVTTGMSNEPEVIDMVDREKDILGKITEGVTGDAKLVASNEYYIEGDVENWTRNSFAIDYKSDVNPEKMNIIFAASDYFDRSALGTGNALTVDDVRFIYNSRLKSLTVGGQEVSGFDNGVFEYQLPADMVDAKVEAKAFGKDAKVTVSKNGNVTTIVVTDDTAKGEKENTYKLTFKGVQTVISLPEAAPSITYGDALDGLGFTSNSNQPFSYSFSVGGILEQKEDGRLHAVGNGEVVVVVRQEANENFTAAVSERLVINVAKAKLKVSLSDGAWCWRGVNVSDYNKKKGQCDYSFVLDGLKGDDAGKPAQDIFAKLPTVRSFAAADGEKAGDMREVTLSGGEIANYEVELVEKAQLKIVKNKVGAYVRYAFGSLNSAYEGESYRMLKVAAGQEEYHFAVEYVNAVYDDEEFLASYIPSVKCEVSKDAQIGESFPVSIELPQAEFENFELVNMVPAEAKVVVAANPNISVTVPEDVKYGDEFQLVSNDKGITYQFDNLTDDVVSVSYKGEATIEKAGEAELIVKTGEKTVDGVVYGMTATRVAFVADKAPLVITAKDSTVNIDEVLPETYELVYEGWVGNDAVDNVFEVAPVAVAELPSGLVAGTYPIIVKVEKMPENYEVKTVNGTLTVKGGNGVDAINGDNQKVTYKNGILYVPCGGRVEVYALTGALVGRYEGAVIPVALRTNTLYIVKTQKGAFRLWVK